MSGLHPSGRPKLKLSNSFQYDRGGIEIAAQVEIDASAHQPGAAHLRLAIEQLAVNRLHLIHGALVKSARVKYRRREVVLLRMAEREHHRLLTVARDVLVGGDIVRARRRETVEFARL